MVHPREGLHLRPDPHTEEVGESCLGRYWVPVNHWGFKWQDIEPASTRPRYSLFPELNLMTTRNIFRPVEPVAGLLATRTSRN